MTHRTLALLAAVAALTGCASTSTSATATTGTSSGGPTTGARVGPVAPGTTTTGTCPVAPVPVVVSVDQWGDIVEDLAGPCGEVTTVLTSATADPHDYEPTAADIARFGKARVVVVNGLDYDPWAEKAVDALNPKPAVVDAGEVAGRGEGDNPHLWYSPDVVQKTAAAVTAELIAASPGAAAVFNDRASAWNASMQPYRDEIGRLKGQAAGRSYGATETVFDDMAKAVGLADATPEGYRNASANESDPSPGDLQKFQRALRERRIDVLIFNAQTEGAIPDQIRQTAEEAGVPVVDVTETLPAGAASFEAWQVAQLQSLGRALG